MWKYANKYLYLLKIIQSKKRPIHRIINVIMDLPYANFVLLGQRATVVHVNSQDVTRFIYMERSIV